MKFKRIISIITSVMLGIAMPITYYSSYDSSKIFLTVAADETEKTYDSWQKAYRDTLDQFKESGSYASKAESGEVTCSTYAVHDMNGDGIPELFINYQPITASASVLYTFYDSKVIKLMILPRAGFVSYCEDDGLIESSGGGGAGGYVYTTYSKIVDGEIVDVDSFMISASTVPSTYSINGMTVSESAYNAAIKQYKDKRWTTVGRENYFDDLFYKYGDIYYEYYFDYYEAAWAVPTSTTLSIANTINGIPVTSIGSVMFDNATDVKILNIPANITDFYYSGLNGSSLTTINVDTSNPYYSSKDGIMYSKDMSELVKFPTAKDVSSYTFPQSVTEIGRFAFAWCSGVSKIVLPEQIEVIRDHAFYCCNNLSSVTFMNPYCDIYDDWDLGEGITICNSYDSSSEKGNYLGVICGYNNSYAQQYADAFDRTFISLGDDPAMTTTTATTTTTTTTTTSTTSTTTTTTSTTSTTTTTTTTTATTAATTTTPPSTTEPVPDYMLGDINNDGIIDASDASAILKEYAALSTGSASTFTEEQKDAGDINKDGAIDASDASAVLSYYAYRSTGGSDDFETYLRFF